MEQPASVSACASVTGPAEVFRALGENWWKPFIDGKFHQYGKNVFDQGLHDGVKEPGYIRSLREAYDFVAAHVTDRVTPELYKKIHSIACAHFAGRKNNTLVSAGSCGKFSGLVSRCRGRLGICLADLPDAERACLFEKWKESNQALTAKWRGPEWLKKRGWAREGLKKREAEAKKWIKQLDQDITQRIEAANKSAKEAASDLGVRPLADLSRIDNLLYCHYHHPRNLEKVVQKTFDLFYERIAAESSLKGRVRHVANVFQTLEWLHPFPDGQGRTDLLLLAKMLCEVGANPAILDEPYVSTFCSLDGWVKCLKWGMERWEKEHASMTAERRPDERVASLSDPSDNQKKAQV